MIETLLAIIGLLVGAAVVYLISQLKTNLLTAQKSQLASDLAVKLSELEQLSARLTEERDAHSRHVEEVNGRYEQQIEGIISRHEQQENDEKTRHQQMVDELNARHQRQVDEMNGRFEREKTEMKEQMDRQLGERLNLVQEQLKTTTEQLLRQRSKELDETNQSQMGAIINPLKETISEMKRAMDDNRDAYNKNTATLSEQLRQMHEATQNIGVEADRLSKALQSGPKVQGNFGEMKLDMLLERFGFSRGEEYDLQQMIRDEYGNAVRHEDTNEKMIPDVILHYPDHKDVIIDSKVSLTAFINYVNAEDDNQRKRYLAEHIGSIRKHVEELSRKDYSKYINKTRVTLDYVIMFVPQEAALLLALTNDTDLWSQAFDKRVFITGEQNLFAVLRMLQIAWTQQRQTVNQEKVYGYANELLDRVGDFIKRYEDIGDKLQKVQQAYDNTRKKLDGHQSILVPARELRKLGAKENPLRPIPDMREEEETDSE